MTHPIRIVLVDTTHPGNLGAAARAMKNMGLEELVLVRPRAFPHAEATSRASGADDLLARARVAGSIGEAVEGCGLVLGTSARPRSANWVVHDPRSAARLVVDSAQDRPVAILFGSERNGLSNEDLGACHALLNVPADPRYESLNLAHAVQIVTWEIRMAGAPAVRRLEPEAPPASAGQIERLREHMATVIGQLGFKDERNVANLVARLERLLLRSVPDEKEVQILRGVLTAIQRGIAAREVEDA